jgi:hypothetical protein
VPYNFLLCNQERSRPGAQGFKIRFPDKAQDVVEMDRIEAIIGCPTRDTTPRRRYLSGGFKRFDDRTHAGRKRRAERGSFYQQATRLDPDYALAYAESSEAWAWIGDLSNGKQKAAWTAAGSDAEKAVAIDPGLAEAHAALGWVRFFIEWKFPEGLAELARAAALSVEPDR